MSDHSFVTLDYENKLKLTNSSYEALYRQSIEAPETFWGTQGKRLDWIEPYTKVKNVSYEGEISIRWFEDGVLNACYNCVDRHLPERAAQTAFIWEGDNPSVSNQVTYQMLYENVCRFANLLKKRGVQKGDRVTIYMPMIPEAIYAMLACARIGAIHSVVFGGFSSNSLKDRILDCDSTCVITADEAVRGGKIIPLKKSVDEALQECPAVHTVLTVQHTKGDVPWKEGRDVWWHDTRETVSASCPCVPMQAEDPLFILYTSGSTGKPKGVLHTTGGYLVYASLTHEYVFDLQKDDVYWCTADIGWITGHSYIVYGPLANGVTSVIFEGVPTFPDPSRFWQIVDKHQVTLFYTAPTAIRALMCQGEEYVLATKRSSLRVLGTVGEPINPEAWRWYFKTVGEERCPIVDTWWQTETGGILITPLPGVISLKPGSATRPFFGVQPAIVDRDGVVLEGEAEGNLCLLDSWPGQMRSVYKDHDRFVKTYFSAFPGKYFTGDGCARDKDGYYWITGRVDDVINVSGHRLGTAEIESALVAHGHVAEAAVVGFPHPIKGQGIYAYVTLNTKISPHPDLEKELVQGVRRQIGPVATPDCIQWAPSLPKTRSGKIMRRILRKIASGENDSFGDVSTLSDPTVVQDLVQNRKSGV